MDISISSNSNSNNSGYNGEKKNQHAKARLHRTVYLFYIYLYIFWYVSTFLQLIEVESIEWERGEREWETHKQYRYSGWIPIWHIQQHIVHCCIQCPQVWLQHFSNPVLRINLSVFYLEFFYNLFFAYFFHCLYEILQILGPDKYSPDRVQFKEILNFHRKMALQLDSHSAMYKFNWYPEHSFEIQAPGFASIWSWPNESIKWVFLTSIKVFAIIDGTQCVMYCFIFPYEVTHSSQLVTMRLCVCTCTCVSATVDKRYILFLVIFSSIKEVKMYWLMRFMCKQWRWLWIKIAQKFGLSYW